MRKKLLFSLVSMIFMSLVFSDFALAEKAKKDVAYTLAEKGADYMKAYGIDKSVEAFKTDDFKQGDIFLFAYNYEGVCVAHGAKAKQIGKNLYKVKTPERAKSPKRGWSRSTAPFPTSPNI